MGNPSRGARPPQAMGSRVSAVDQLVLYDDDMSLPTLRQRRVVRNALVARVMAWLLVVLMFAASGGLHWRISLETAVPSYIVALISLAIVLRRRRLRLAVERIDRSDRVERVQGPPPRVTASGVEAFESPVNSTIQVLSDALQSQSKIGDLVSGMQGTHQQVGWLQSELADKQALLDHLLEDVRDRERTECSLRDELSAKATRLGILYRLIPEIIGMTREALGLASAHFAVGRKTPEGISPSALRDILLRQLDARLTIREDALRRAGILLDISPLILAAREKVLAEAEEEKKKVVEPCLFEDEDIG